MEKYNIKKKKKTWKRKEGWVWIGRGCTCMWAEFKGVGGQFWHF